MPPPPSSSKRPESPPYTTSEMNQNIDEYQQTFWQRQMAKVEEQAYLSAEENTDNASVGTSSSKSGGTSALAGAGGSSKDLMDLFKPQAGQLPLARIKKVMKASDDHVKMISAEAPILFAKACEIFIADLTSRAYINATSHRRRTVQQSDIVAAISGSNQFDFLVDVVPRGVEASRGGSRKRASKREESGEAEGEEEIEGEDEAEESEEHTTDS